MSEGFMLMCVRVYVRVRDRMREREIPTCRCVRQRMSVQGPKAVLLQFYV